MDLGSEPPVPEQVGAGAPRWRPSERFWPYVGLPEQPTEEELALLEPDLRAVLYGAPPQPFSLTITFPQLDSPDYDRAVEIARSTAGYREMGDTVVRHRARFFPSDAARLRDLWQIVGRFDSCEVLVDDRPLPYARELWLPLFWFLLES
jgi:hypothetical protein